ncbi:hypothetical protein [Nocardia higoensis]|uniref:hypothetical protein n=1 Tax=Nocardia higoensis TaxID=228599 RepID=UPI00031BC103|nr:hypothetical protein [Nocardia higoensis]
MSPVPPPPRVRDIPADHAEGLRRIHQLTTESTRLHRALNTTNTAADRLNLLHRADTTDRDRALLEIDLRSRGVPAAWIAVARRLGTSQHPWNPNQILPPARTDPQRRSRNRVATDTHLLVDMAAVSTVRDHLLHHHRTTTNDTTAAATTQFHRNMSAIWQRSVITAELIELSHTQCARITTTAAADLTQRISAYRDMSLDDIHTLWHAYTGGGLADTYRRSITATPASSWGANLSLHDPQHWLDHARTHLAGGGPPEHNHGIECAVTAAIPGPILGNEPGYRHSDGLEEVPGPNAAIDAGPDP